MIIEYNSNNSGGSFWLKDKDWEALEKAGWEVIWGGMYFCHSQFSFNKKPKGKTEPCEKSDSCGGHIMYDSFEEAKENRDMFGQVAQTAKKDFQSLGDAIREWEEVTGQDSTDEGCNCCGAPHSFSSEGNYCSGEDCAEYLYSSDFSSLTKRELLEKLSKK